MKIKIAVTSSVVALAMTALSPNSYARDHGPGRGVDPVPAFNGAPLVSADYLENLKRFNSPGAVERLLYSSSPAASAYKGMPLTPADNMENLKRFNSPGAVERILYSLSPAAAASKGVALTQEEVVRMSKY